MFSQELDDFGNRKGALLDIGKTASDLGAIDKPDGDPMGLSYNEFISPLIKAVQELKKENVHLKEKNLCLEEDKQYL